MFAAWRVGTIRVDGISVEAPKENASFSLESFSMTGWSNAGLDSLLLKNLEAAAARTDFFRLASLELAGFVAPDLKALVKFAALEKNSDLPKHAEAIRETFAALPRLAHFGLHDLAAGKSEADSGSLAELHAGLHRLEHDLGRRNRHPHRRAQHPAPAAGARSADDRDFRHARL